MTYTLIELKNLADGKIVQITLKRSNKRNALNLTMMEELVSAFEEMEKNSVNRVAILAAEGSVFCSGMDLAEASDISLVKTIAQHIANLLTAIHTSSLVTIASVQGDAIAGGGGLVAACDFAIAAKHARIGFPETRRGLVAAQVSALLCRQLPIRWVRELLLLGELVDSERTLAMGLVSRVVEKEVLYGETMHFARLVLEGAPGATRATKKLLHKLEHSAFQDDLQSALAFHYTARHSDEAQEGIKAFLEKRSPSWSFKSIDM